MSMSSAKVGARLGEMFLDVYQMQRLVSQLICRPKYRRQTAKTISTHIVFRTILYSHIAYKRYASLKRMVSSRIILLHEGLTFMTLDSNDSQDRKAECNILERYQGVKDEIEAERISCYDFEDDEDDSILVDGCVMLGFQEEKFDLPSSVYHIPWSE
jgi:hypothetical protein